MTVPIEMIYSLRKTREFLFDLMDSNKTPKLPKKVRRQAGRCIKHFPFSIYEKDILQGILDGRNRDEKVEDTGFSEVESKRLEDYTEDLPYWWTKDD